MVRNVLKNKEKSLKLTTLGFTLIELLSVIVILAIIALIATPIILGIIRDAKEQASERSVDNYLSALEQAIVRKNMTEKFNPTECNIVDGKVICEGKELKVEVDGEVPKNGTIYFLNGSVSTGTLLNFESYTKKINNLASENVRVVTTPTTGIVPIQEENGNIKTSSEFQIKVNDTSGWLTFFVLSNEGDYVNLIAEQNIAPDGTFTSEQQDGDNWYITTSENRFGPQTAYTYLSIATNNWINIPILESFNYLDEGNQSDSDYGYQNIMTTFEEKTGKYITTITPLSDSTVTYENMRARLPYVSEITQNENTGCKIFSSPSDRGSCQLWMVNYLSSSSKYTSEQKVNSAEDNFGYWLLSAWSGYSNNACTVDYKGSIEHTNSADNYNGVCPVITVLKSDLLKVMQ